MSSNNSNPVLSALAGASDQVRELSASVTAELTRIRSLRQQKEIRIQELLRAGMTKADYLDYLKDEIDARGNAVAVLIAGNVSGMLRRGAGQRDTSAAPALDSSIEHGRGAGARSVLRLLLEETGADEIEAECFRDPEGVKACAARVFDRVTWPHAEPVARAEGLREIEQLKAEIADIDAQERELVERAQAIGIQA